MDNLTKYLKYKNLYLELKKKSKSKDLIGGVPGLARGYEKQDKYVQNVANHWYNTGGRQISYSHKQKGYYLMNHYRHELDDYGFPYEDWYTHVHIIKSEYGPIEYNEDGTRYQHPDTTVGLHFSLKSYDTGLNIPAYLIQEVVNHIINNRLFNGDSLNYIEAFIEKEIRKVRIDSMIVSGPDKNDIIIIDNADEKKGEIFMTTSLNVLSHISKYMEKKLKKYYG
jgi:hypothetical protein